MAYPAITYSFTNGTPADATEVNQNFADVITGLSDGAKDYNMRQGTLTQLSCVTVLTSMNVADHISAPSATIPILNGTVSIAPSAVSNFMKFMLNAVYPPASRYFRNLRPTRTERS